jgi:hypothetical protein
MVFFIEGICCAKKKNRNKYTIAKTGAKLYNTMKNKYMK